MVTVRLVFTVFWDPPGVSLGIVTVWLAGMVRVGLVGYRPSRMLAAWVALSAPRRGRARIRVRRKVERPMIARVAMRLVIPLFSVILGLDPGIQDKNLLHFKPGLCCWLLLLFPPPDGVFG